MEEKKKKDENKKKNYKKYWVILIVVLILIGIIVFAITRHIELNREIQWNTPVEPIITQEDRDRQRLTPMKPIIYLYPEEETELTVKLGNPDKVVCSYPKYKDGWNVIARPDGTMTDIETKRELYSLYWEGKEMPSQETNKGFVIKGEDTISFFEEKLKILGLNERETEEFIIYWLPQMQDNKYNYIRFATMEEINEYMPLEISKKPDTLIRILMEFRPLEEYKELEEQKLIPATERTGFTVVEWGGSKI